MAKLKDDKVILAEHTLEVRHIASGTFLDVRGYVADYIRQAGTFHHWQIDANVVNFRDESNAVKSEGAFVGYKSAGYVALNPQTRNYFTDRASSFWKLLLKNRHYKVPDPTRFGIRTKVFVPSSLTFEKINKTIYESFYTESARALIGGKQTDLQFSIDLKEGVFDVHVRGGPTHKDEAGRYMQFESDHFKQCGLFLDMDFYKTEGLSLGDIPALLRNAVGLTWHKVELMASGIGL